MRKLLTFVALSSLIFISLPASANFVFGNASKYDLHFHSGNFNFDVTKGAKPVVLPYNLKHKKYPITFNYIDPVSKKTVFKGIIIGNVTCQANDVKSCRGSINLKKKTFADFIEVYAQNQAGDVNLVFDDLPTMMLNH